MENEYVVAGRDQGGKGMALNVIDGLNIGKPSAENQRITESFVPAALQALISYGQLWHIHYLADQMTHKWKTYEWERNECIIEVTVEYPGWNACVRWVPPPPDLRFIFA